MASVPKRHKPKSVNLAKGAKARPGSMRSDGWGRMGVVGVGRWPWFFVEALRENAETKPLFFGNRNINLSTI